MSHQQRRRSDSKTQSTSPYQNTEEQGLPLDAERQTSTASSSYSQPSYNENAQQPTSPTTPRGDPPQERDGYYHEQPPYYPGSVVAGDAAGQARDSSIILHDPYSQEQPRSYPYVQGYDDQYGRPQSDYRNLQDNYRASHDNYREPKDLYRGSYDPRAGPAYQNSPYNTNMYPNNPSQVPYSHPSGNGQFDIYSDFNNTRPQFDEDDDSRAPTPTLRNSDSPQESDAVVTKSYSDQLTQGLIDEKKRQRSPRCCCCSRKTCVIITFIILVVLGITAYFVYPRIPSVSILDAQPDGTPVISLSAKRLQMKFKLRIQIKNPDNWVPIRFNEIDAQVYDVNTLKSYDRPIATGNVTNYSLPPRTDSVLNFPLIVDYIGNSTTDPTILDFQSACTPPTGDNKATTLNVRADITLSVWGISWIYKPHTSVGLSDLVCPYSQISQYLNSLNDTGLGNLLNS